MLSVLTPFFYFTELKSCTPNPCKHGGKCNVLDQSFHCDCEGTGYKGSKCQKGFIATSVFPKLSARSKSKALYLSAQPSNKLTILLYAENGLVFYPSPSLDIIFPETRQTFFVEAEKAGIRRIYYGLGGPNKPEFEVPEESFFLVTPRMMINESVYSKLFLPKGELPLGCNEHISKVLACKVSFISTNRWTGNSPVTEGIVHIRTSSNNYIPLSVVGLSFDELEISKKLLIQAAVARTSSSGVLSDFYMSNGTCIQKELRSDNLLELMKDDAVISSFMRSLTKMAPKWLQLASNEENKAFDIRNIEVNVSIKAPLKEEYCSHFPLNPFSSIAYLRPTAKYEVRVSDDTVYLFADGDTCFAADICKQSIFIHFPKRSVNELIKLAVLQGMKDKGVVIRVDSVGTLENSDIIDVEIGEIWNGTHFNKVSPFSYNMWLRGDVTWKLQIPANLEVTLHIAGESYMHYEKIDEVSLL